MGLLRLRIDELASTWVGDANTPFQFGLLGVFDPGPWSGAGDGVDIEHLAAELALRARCVPELRRRVVWTRPWEGRPVWVDDQHFDPSRHIGQCHAPDGEDLLTWAADRCAEPLDLHRPLWRAVVVDRLPSGGFAVLLVVHHVLVDGLLGVRLAGSLFDSSADAVPPSTAPPAVAPVPSHRELVRDLLRSPRGGDAPRRRPHPPGGRGRPLAGFRDAMRGFRAPLPATSLPRVVGPRRLLVEQTVPLDAVRSTGHALGATVNDLVLAMVTDGLRELLAGRGELTAGLFLRATVPVATGRPGQAMGMLVVDLPVGEADPRRRLDVITAATSAGKARLHAAGGDVTAILRLPLPLTRPLVRWGRRVGSRRINLSVSNVPGPGAALWLAGAKMVRAVPIAPLVPVVPLSVAALSYDGSLSVAVDADASITDLGVVQPALEQAFLRHLELGRLARDAGRSEVRPLGRSSRQSVAGSVAPERQAR